MKPLISLIAMSLGVATVAFIVTVQNDPLVFTTLHGRGTATNPVNASLETLPVPTAADFVANATETNPVIRIREVTIVGRLSRSAKTQIQDPSQATIRALDVRTLPAPCRDGEYRLLEPNRGVRLMCL